MLIKQVDCASYLFEATLPDARHYNVLIAKRAFEIDPTGQLVSRQEQELLNFADVGYGEPQETSLLYPSDIVPFKPATDVIIAADAVAPHDMPQKSWVCGVRVEGDTTLDSKLRVYGPRKWQPEWLLGKPKKPSARTTGFRKWTLSDPELTKRVPIRYENAWGGGSSATVVQDEDQMRVCEMNPIGTGWIDQNLTDHTEAMVAPQIEWADDPISDPYDEATPAGFGPIMPAWLPRRSLGGTFNQNWIDNQRPWWPTDYDFGFHNAAPLGLQWNGFMRGDETFMLHNLVSHDPDFAFKLPETGLVVAYDGIEQKMALDTVLLDVRASDPDEWLITLTWRLALPQHLTGGMSLDEVYVAHPRYQSAQAPHVPSDVADFNNKELEAAHG